MEERIKALETELENLKTKWRESQQVKFTPGNKVLHRGAAAIFLMPAKFNPDTGDQYNSPNECCLIYKPGCMQTRHGALNVMLVAREKLEKI